MNPVQHYLQELIDAGERADPLVFSGREEEIGRIARAADKLPPDGPTGRTFLIQGASGSGKTALIAELSRRLEIMPGTGVVSLASVPVDSTAERTYGNLAALLVGAPRPGQEHVETATTRIEGDVGFTRAGASATARTSSPTYLAADDIAYGSGGAWHPQQRVVLFVDEVQMLKPDNRAAKLLFDLHTQASIPVLLVCAGLGNSQLILSNAGFSQLENLLPLGRLTSTESLDCARRSLRRVAEKGVRSTDTALDRWAVALSRAADDWPRHLQVYLQAAWIVLLRQETPDLDSALLADAITIGDRRQAEYYEDRLAASRTPIEVIAALHRQLASESDVREPDACRVIGHAVQKLDSVTRKEWDSQFDARPKKCLEALLRVGVVSLDLMYRCVSPAPSFSRYILGQVRTVRC